MNLQIKSWKTSTFFNWVPNIPDLYIVPQFFSGTQKSRCEFLRKKSHLGTKKHTFSSGCLKWMMNNKPFDMEHGWKSPFLSIHSKTGRLKFQDDLNPCQNPSKHSWKSWGCFLFRWMRQTCYPWWKHDWIFCFWLVHDTGPFIAAKGIMWIPYAQIIVNFIIFHPKISISPEIRATPILLAKDSARTNKYRPQVRSWFFAFEILKKTWFANIPHVQTASFLGVLITAHEKYSRHPMWSLGWWTLLN